MRTNQNVKGKVVLVTGSTSGIGLAIALGFAKAGAQVVLNGFEDQATAQKLIDTLAQEFDQPLDFQECDVSSPVQISKMIKAIQEKQGSLDVLVNNAGVQFTSEIEFFPAEKWDKVLAVNLSSVFHSTALAVPLMKKRNYGRIINIASVHGLVGSVEKAAYVAAKHGVIGLTKVTALENAPSNITCNAICPGWVKTPLIEAQIQALAIKEGVSLDVASHKMLEKKEPSLRFTTVEDIAEMALFLCGVGGNNMTGSAIAMDGGWTAQ